MMLRISTESELY